MSKKLRMRFRRHDRDGYETSTIFTSAVRSLFLPLLDTSGDAEKQEPEQSKARQQKSDSKQPPPRSESEAQRAGRGDGGESGEADSPRRLSGVSIPRIDVPVESEKVQPVQIATPCEEQHSSGLQPLTPSFRQISPTFRRGRFSITELEVVNIDTERLNQIRAESDGRERSPTPSIKEDRHAADEGRPAQSSAEGEAAQEKDDSAISSAPISDQSDTRTPSTHRTDDDDKESGKAKDSLRVEEVSFVPASPTIRRGRFNVTPLEVSASESSGDKSGHSDKTRADDTCHDIEDIRDEEKPLGEEDDEEEEETHETIYSVLVKPLKSILRNYADPETSTIDSSEGVKFLTKDGEEEEARTPSTDDEGDHESVALVRLPFTPRHLDDILQPVHLQRKKSVRFTEPMQGDKKGEGDKNTMNGGNDNNEEKENETHEEEIEDKNRRYSITSLRPQCLDHHEVKKEFCVFLYILLGLGQGIALNYIISVISTIEGKFGITSRQTGSLLGGHDMAQVILSLILSYHGKCGHRLRWIVVGVALGLVSCVLTALTHFLYAANGIWVSNGQELLLNDTLLIEYKEELCFQDGDDLCSSHAAETSILGVILLLFVSQFFMGLALTVFFTVGVTYMEKSIDKKMFPLYYGFMLALRVLGPVLGYISGPHLLNTWGNSSKTPNHTKRKTELLDVWWIGSLYIICGLAIAGSLSFFFPRQTPAFFRKRMRKIKAKEKHADIIHVEDPPTKEVQAQHILRETGHSLRRVFTNKLWLVNLFNTTAFALAVSSYWSLRPTYIQSQFRKTSADANYYTGLSSLLSSVFGMGLSSVVFMCMRPKSKLLMGYSTFLTLCGGAAFIGLIFVGCPQLEIVGPVAGSVTPPCAADCGCSENFSPMCSEDQTTLYFSPCYAGCTLANVTASPTVYYGCSCIEPQAKTSSQSPVDLEASYTTSGLQGTVTLNQGGSGISGFCPESCASFFNYIVLLILTQSVYPSARVSNVIIMLRSVPEEDKVMALSTLTVFISLFAFIPAPIIMSTIVDSSCLVWGASCGETGSCWLYNIKKFRTVFHMFPAVFVFLCVLCDVAVFYYTRNFDLYVDRREDLEKRRGSTEEAKPLRGKTFAAAKV